MLGIVACRNLIELSGSEFDFTGGFSLPKSFGWVRGNNVLWTISYVSSFSVRLPAKCSFSTHWSSRQKPVLTVMTSEMIVDWLKHAFITKFNHIRPSVYERYVDVLCRDLASMSAVGRRGARKVCIFRIRYIRCRECLYQSSLQHSYVDQSPLVARRLGFASLPLAALVILVGSQSIGLMFSSSSDFASPWTWTIRSLSNAEIMHYMTWGVMGLLFWLWCVAILFFACIQSHAANIGYTVL